MRRQKNVGWRRSHMTFAFTQKDCELFWQGWLFNLLTLYRDCHTFGIQNLSDNWCLGVVCVVVAVYPFELDQRAPAGYSPWLLLCIFWYRLYRQKEITGQEQILKLIQLFLSLLFSIGKCAYNCVYAFKVISFWFNFDYNWLYTIFYQMKQGVKRTDTCVLSRRLSRQVHGLSNRCKFALANGLAGRFISRYWVSLIGSAFALLGSLCGTSAHRWISVI